MPCEAAPIKRIEASYLRKKQSMHRPTAFAGLNPGAAPRYRAGIGAWRSFLVLAIHMHDLFLSGRAALSCVVIAAALAGCVSAPPLPELPPASTSAPASAATPVPPPVAAAPSPVTHRILFLRTSTRLGPQGLRMTRELIRPANTAVRVVLTGFSALPEKALSEKQAMERALSVRAVLVAGGVAADSIELQTSSKEKLAVVDITLH
jgi:hypothetical protein